MPELLSFEWARPAKGYKIMEWGLDFAGLLDTETLTNVSDALVHEPSADPYKDRYDPLKGYPRYVLIPNARGEWVSYQPLKDGHALFMEYAKIDTWGELADFLSKYGPLWDILGLRRPGDGVISSKDLYFSSVWSVLFRVGVDRWEESRRTGEYSKLLDWFNFDGPYHRVDAESDDYGSIGVIPTLAPNRAGGVPRLTLQPRHLAGAIHLQFAQAVTNDSQLQKCAVCPTWFAYGTGTGRRKSAHYCSDKCRKAAHRRQKAENNNG